MATSYTIKRATLQPNLRTTKQQKKKTILNHEKLYLFYKDVQPIRSKKKIEAMKKALLKHCSYRDYLLFLIGINSAYRVSDLLRLKVRDVKGKDKFVLGETKTGKVRAIPIHTNLKRELTNYIKKRELANDDYLFQSRKGNNKPISRQQAYRILNKAAQYAGVSSVGTHTMRKTFAYSYFDAFGNIAHLMELLNHSKESITLAYIGVLDSEIEENLKGFYL